MLSEQTINRTDSDHKHLTGAREIPLTRGRVALVDAADYAALAPFRWRSMSPNGRATNYAARQSLVGLKPVTLLMHRVIMAPAGGMVVDHINGDGLDNRRENLRVCTHAENLRNQRKAKSNTSGFKGVSFYHGSWRVTLAGEYLGCFRTAEEGALVYDAAAIALYGEFANLNFPERPSAPLLEQGQ